MSAANKNVGHLEFHNRRAGQKYLKNVFPAGFGNAMRAREDKVHTDLHGVNAKTISKSSDSLMVDQTLKPKSFMSWAQGDGSLSDTRKITSNRAVDDFADVAGPYFHEAQAQSRPSSRGNHSRPSTSNTRNVYGLYESSTAPPVVAPAPMVRELTTHPVPIGVRKNDLGGNDTKFRQDGAAPIARKQKIKVRARIFQVPSSLPTLHSTFLSSMSSMLNPASPDSQYDSGAILRYEEWLVERRANSSWDNEMERAVPGASLEHGSVPDTHFAGGASRRHGKGNGSYRHKSDLTNTSFDDSRMHASLLGFAGSYSSGSDGPVPRVFGLEIELEIHKFKDVVGSVTVNDANRYSSRRIPSDASLASVSSIISSFALSASVPDEAISRGGRGAVLVPVIFYFRPTLRAWRPVRNEVEWRQAKTEILEIGTTMKLMYSLGWGEELVEAVRLSQPAGRWDVYPATASAQAAASLSATQTQTTTVAATATTTSAMAAAGIAASEAMKTSTDPAAATVSGIVVDVTESRRGPAALSVSVNNGPMEAAGLAQSRGLRGARHRQRSGRSDTDSQLQEHEQRLSTGPRVTLTSPSVAVPTLGCPKPQWDTRNPLAIPSVKTHPKASGSRVAMVVVPLSRARQEELAQRLEQQLLKTKW